MKKNPIMARNCRNTDTDPAEKARLRNNRGSRSGSAVRSPEMTKAPRATAPPISPARVRGFAQPRVGPSVMPRTNPPMARIESNEPLMSTRGAAGSLVAGTRIMAATHATTAKAAVTTKIDPHQNCSSSAPEPTRPRTAPAPAKPLHTATARARSSAGKTLVMVDRVLGMIRAAPMPERTRRTISSAGEVTSADRAAVTPKTPMPTSRRVRLP